ncbi:hypothetical protein HOLleu_19055 [Holothuria leucospilota]|uniref:Centrosomal protein of 131 kDa n=1 Tax=Holothuria leucospilota TaxID=206669 RepID=A0A9Q1C4N2_HOLLE|nr:hypothetical protein HOLleu_19055 [Holothuria leucospilota]
MPRQGDISLSLTGSQVSTVKRLSSASGTRLSSTGSNRGPNSRPGSSASNKPTASGKAGQVPLSARSVTFGSNHSTPRSTRRNVGGKTSTKGILSSPSLQRKEDLFSSSLGPSGDLHSPLSNGLDKRQNSVTGSKKHKRASSLNTAVSTNRQDDNTDSLQKSKKMSSTDDFLALFDTPHHQPVIKNRTRTKKEPARKPKEPMSSRAFAVPISARSTSTVSSYGPTSSRPASGLDMSNDKLNSARDFSPRLHPEDLISSQIDTKDLVKNSLANVLSSVQPGSGLDNMDDDFVENEEILFQPRHRDTGAESKNLSAEFDNEEVEKPMSNGRLESSLSREDGENKLEHPMAEELIQSMNLSATKIQKWYRGLKEEKKKEGEDEIRKVLRTKWQERADMMERERREKESEEKKEKDRKRIREEKQRLARQAAIEELQRKREEKQKEIKEKAEEELKFLEASGKVKKKPSGKKTSKRLPSQNGSLASNRAMSPEKDASKEWSERVGGDETRERPGTSSSLGKKVEDIFQSVSTWKDNAADETATETPSVTTHTKTTLDDLLDTLKQLEEPVRVPSPEMKKAKGPAWLDIFDEKEDAAEETLPTPHQRLRASSNPVYLSAENLQELTKEENTPTKAKPNPSSHALLTEEKLKLLSLHFGRNIMSFLDEIDQADPENISQLNKQEINGELANPPTLVPSAEEIQKLEEASAAASEVTSTILSQRLQLEEKDRSIKMLQKGLNQQRELTLRHAKEQDKETKKRLELQKEEYETTIKRHLSFIDQLIDDKKALSEKYDSVVKELKQVDKKYQTRIKAMEENQGIELQKVKDVHQAAEKIRREKWIDEKTKKIKEITVKGLEPEIQRLIANHKAEIKKIKTIHEAELLQAEERAGQKYIQHTEELREQLAHEKEQACARERELSKQRYEKQLEQEEAGYQQQRRRLYQEIQDEKERIAEQAKKQRQELDRLQHQMEENNRKALATLREEYEKARDEQERRHKTEVKDMEERLRIEKESWEENYMKKQETTLMSKERELKEKVREERDREIELVITRLEEDAATAREETERAAENRIKRIRDKYEAELKEIELSERNTQERYNEIKAKLAEVEAENFRVQGLLKQREQEVEDIKKVCSRLTSERNNVQEVIRQEFADRLVATEEENKRLKNEMSEMRARHKLEISRIETSKEEEMEEVHRRVKQAISKKEEVVNQLKEQHASAVKRADHLESLLEQQRKQLVKKK